MYRILASLSFPLQHVRLDRALTAANSIYIYIYNIRRGEVRPNELKTRSKKKKSLPLTHKDRNFGTKAIRTKEKKISISRFCCLPRERNHEVFVLSFSCLLDVTGIWHLLLLSHVKSFAFEHTERVGKI
jgi:hypothetical protein